MACIWHYAESAACDLLELCFSGLFLYTCVPESEIWTLKSRAVALDTPLPLCLTAMSFGSIAQMYPEDFEGMVIGMPVLNITWEALQDIWNAKATLVGPGAIPVSNLPMLAKAVYQKCDSIDGLVDGLIDDPRICLDYFNPVIDLALPPYSDYFTYEQRESLLKIYEGPKTSWVFNSFMEHLQAAKL